MQIHLPPRLHLTSFDTLYERLHRLSPTESLDLHMNALQFAEPAGLLPLACVLRNHVRAGGALTIRAFPTDLDVCGYLERINFYKLVNSPCPHDPGKRKSSDVFIEITEMDGSDLPHSVQTKLHSLVQGRVDLRDAAGDSFLLACGELVDNTRHAYNAAITEQAAAWPPPLILAQYYQPSNTLHVTAVDCGIGIRRSLEAKDPEDAFKSDKLAIERALILGMKGFHRSGKGLGLAAIARFMKQNRGVFAIRSGECFSIRRPHKQNREVAPWKGTIVTMEINGARNTDISDIIKQMEAKPGSKK